MIQQVYDTLLKAYGPQGWWPLINPNTLVCEHKGIVPRNEEDVFEIAVGAILTQNTSWKNVEKALAELKRSGNLSEIRIKSLPHRKLAGLIRSAGYYNQKAKKLKLLAEFDKEVTRENLLNMWGVGPETADSILLYAYQKPFFVVDAYTRRIFSRLGLVKDNASYYEIQELFHRSLKKNVKVFKEYHALLVEHAKRHCRTDPECEGCPLNINCRSFKNQKQ